MENTTVKISIVLKMQISNIVIINKFELVALRLRGPGDTVAINCPIDFVRMRDVSRFFFGRCRSAKRTAPINCNTSCK